MALRPGTRIGSYEVTGVLGAGGMGEVYRAHDSRLGRDVALKILPETFIADADRLARFERESKTLAALNHPNIAHVYDAGRAGALVFMAMELVDGEDLAARISRGPVPVPEAIAIARQIADGLAAAHEIGVIHRDLKPANIKVRDDGTVKVLDFGLAKVTEAGGGSGAGASAMNSPTLTSRGTEVGMILGTAAYMAPEQARGKVVDRRADLWAFGVVLYEMLTGRRAFDGPEVSDVLASVLKDTPSLDALPKDVPASVRRLLTRTLEKDRARRLDSMVAARFELNEDTEGAEGAERRTRSARRTWLIAGAAAVVAFNLALVAGPWIWKGASTAPPSGVIVSQIAAPHDVISAFFDGFALSPDGKTLLFAGRNAAGVRQIWLRPLDTGTAHPVPGTEAGAYPFWAPDGKAFAFFADGKIRRVAPDGGQLQVICTAQGSFPSGSWSTRDEIVFGFSNGSPLFKVPAAGGSPVALDALGKGFGPVWLADGRRLLFAGGTGADDWGLRLSSADATTSQLIAPLSSGNKPFTYAAGLVFLNRNDTLNAQRLDDATGALAGEGMPIASIAGTPKQWFAVASDGHRVVALVRQAPTDTGDPGDPMARLLWVDRQGNTLGTLGDPGHYWTFRLAPDGARAAVNPDSDLWLLRPEGRHTRLTTGAHDNQSYNAVWSHDGSEIVYSNSAVRGLVRQRVDGQSPASPLAGARGNATDWSSDGRWLLTRTGPSTNSDIIVYDFQTKSSRAWLATDQGETQARFSPDGKWVAYASNKNGPQEVYVRAFEGPEDAIPVSTAGGSFPIWRRDGNELYFLDAADNVMAAPLVRSATTIAVGKPQRLFRIPLNDITRTALSPYDVAPDGQRFLLNVPDRPTPLLFLQGLETVAGKK